MKLRYKLGYLVLGIVAFASCVEDEPYQDNSDINVPATTCSWEVGSTICKTGGKFTFKGQYSSIKDYSFSHSEVWYDIIRIDDISVSAKLAGYSFPYTKTISLETLVRNKEIFKFDHSFSTWDGEKFVITDSVPVSSTLSPITWNSPKEWEQHKWDTYIPKEFAENFERSIDSLIVTNDYYNALRYLYINYAFSNRRFAEINALFGTAFPTDIAYDESDAQAGATDKSTRWFDYAHPKVPGKTPAVVGYYYQTVDDGGNITYHEVGIDAVYEDNWGNITLLRDGTTRVYEIYESAEWVFSRYDDDWGLIKSTVRPEYIAAFKALIEPITIQEWIYNSSDGYAISFNRKYILDASFRVVELDENVTPAEDNYYINIY